MRLRGAARPTACREAQNHVKYVDVVQDAHGYLEN